MSDPNRLMKWLLIIALVVLSLAVLYPPQRKLKGGIDLVGGTSLLFEIDTSGLKSEGISNLSTRVMRVLKDRVDPKGQLNLEWRPVGNTRLEIRMPRPPREALERRAAYNTAIDRLQSKSIKRRDVEEALGATGNNRSTLLDALGRGLAARPELIAKVASDYDELQRLKSAGGQEAADPAAVDSASKAYEGAMSALLATNLPISRLTDILALAPGANRVAQIDKLRSEYAAFDSGETSSPDGKLLTKAIEAYDGWAANKAELEDPSDLKRRLRGAGVLEFRILAERDAGTPTQLRDPNPLLVQPISKYTEQLAKYGPRPKGDPYRWFPIEDPLRFSGASDMEEFKKHKDAPGGPVIEEYAGRFYVLMHDDSDNRMVKGVGQGRSWELRSAYPDRNPMTGENVVSFALNPTGGQIFGELTGKNVNRQLAILLDQQAISHATIRERITEHCQISGRFTPERVNELVGVLEAGSLPARLKETPLSEETIGPSLGETNRTNGIRASWLGCGLVAVFALVYYGLAGGGIANLALAMNILLTLAAMALMQSTFTLPGIAGVVLTVGMAIDANVLIFERIREERARGVQFKKALNLGYEKAFPAIFDSNLTTLISCVILGVVASEEIKGFAITLGIGLTTSMFTALFCTRLAYNSMIAMGWLEDFHMLRLVGVPKIDWVGLRRYFLPASAFVTTVGLAVFLYVAIEKTEQLFDIEFIGGTALQIDLKPGVTMSDEDVREAVIATGATKERSAVQWLAAAADQLKTATVASGELPGQFTVTAQGLSGEGLAVLLRGAAEPMVERNGIKSSGSTASFLGRVGVLTADSLRGAVEKAAGDAREAATRLRGARVQSVGEKSAEDQKGLSYEVVTVETNRSLVQQAILAAFGDKLAVQRAIDFHTVRDEELTREPFFVVETEDQYLSDVIGGDAAFDVRRFQGGVAVETILDDSEDPITTEMFEARMREVGLMPEFEQFRSRDTAVFPLGAAMKRSDGSQGYRRFAVCAVDEAVLHDEDPAQWTEVVAPSVLHQVEAALGIEKSFSKVVQFAPQVAGQARNRALFAIALALAAIAIYVWFRFSNRDFGFAVVVALFHDVTVTLGLIGISHFVYNNPIAKLLLFNDFRVDLSMVAAILTIIGYSLNDTIVVFDRIRENRGRSGTLSAALINDSINQTMSRTLLTSLTVFIVVFVLYVLGGDGVHGFSMAMLMGVITGTYSTVGIAVPMVYNPRVLVNVVWTIVAVCMIGLVALLTPSVTWRLVLTGAIVIGTAFIMLRASHRYRAEFEGHPAGA